MRQHVCVNFIVLMDLVYIYFLVITKEKWEHIMKENNWNNVELRDNRYNQIIHMVSAAKGAEEFYSIEVRKRHSSAKFRKVSKTAIYSRA